MKPVILLAVLALAATACDRRDDVQDESRTTDTTLAPGTDTSTDPAAALDRSARAANPELLEPARDETAAPPSDAAMDETGMHGDATQADDAVEREYPTDGTSPPPVPPAE